MRKIFAIILICISGITFCNAQNPLLKQWDYSYGGYDADFPFQLLPTPDGGFVISGASNSNALYEKSQDNWDSNMFPTFDCWLVKCTSDGVKQWDRTLGGTSDEFAYSVINTADGGYLMEATTSSAVSGDISQGPIGVFDLWIVKLDGSGNTQWEKRFGGTDYNGGGDVVQTSDDGYLIGGYTSSPVGGDVSEPSFGNADFWILRIDSDGNKLWDKRYGGSGDEGVYKIIPTDDGGFLLAGASTSGISGVKTQDNYVPNMIDLWFVKINAIGNYQWDKVIGSLDDDYSMDIFKTTDSHYVIACSNFANVGGDKTEAGYGVDDYWVMKTDTLMNIIWDHSIGGSNNEDEFGNIFPTAEGNILISGTSYSDTCLWKSELNNGPENTWIVLLDPSGNKIWDKTILTGYTHTELGLGIQLQGGCYLFANDGDAMVAQEKTDDSYNFDYWCVKFCDTSQISQQPSQVNFGAAQQERCQKFCTSFIDSSLNNPTAWQWFFQGGSPPSSTSQNPGSICYNTPGTYDVTLITTNATGNDTLTFPDYITVDPTPPLPTITQVGYTLTSSSAFSYQWQLNAVDIPGAINQSYTVTQTGLYSVLVSNDLGCNASSSLDVLIAGIDEALNSSLISIYPNPSSGIINLSVQQSISGIVEIEILNSVGQSIYSSKEEISSLSFEKQIDLSKAANGFYFLKVNTERGLFNSTISINK